MTWNVDFPDTAKQQLSNRVGDYRILRDLRDNKLIVLVVTVAHRRKVYMDL